MKKAAVFCAGMILTASMMSPVGANAEDQTYTPGLYFKTENTDGITVISDELVIVDPDKLSEGSLTLDVGVYIRDESEKIDAISAKWRSNSDYITLGNLVDPSVSTGTAKEYTTSEGKTFTTDLTPFCYASIQEDGTLSVPKPDMGSYPEINSLYFTSSSLTNPFKWLGASSDEFSFASFNAVIDSQTPDGVYDIVFATKDNTDGDKSVYSHGHLYFGLGDFRDFFPETQNLTVAVGDYDLGDVNYDGSVDARDASLILAEYAVTATGGVPAFNSLSNYIGDVNRDNTIDSRDASVVLSYYAYKSTGGTKSLEEFLGYI